VLSFGLAIALAGLTALVFARLGMAQALALAIAAGNRNMGLMLAAATAVPELTWLYFAVAQFPIYLMPAMLKPLARRVAPASSP
jgi:BASS family bile acid:Na+ symporter